MIEKIAGEGCGADQHGRSDTEYKCAAIEGRAAASEFLATDFDRLLTAQITRLVFVKRVGPVRIGIRRCGVARHGLFAFHTTTSCSSSTSNALCTRSRTSAISVSMSFAEAEPAFTKKLAWRSLMRASPTLSPFNPSSSIMRPADAPAGFLKIQPALFWPSGWLDRRFSLQIRIPARISLNGLEGSSSFTASIISSGAKDVCRYSNEIWPPFKVSMMRAPPR